MDIRTKKPKVINLRKKKIATPIKIGLDDLKQVTPIEVKIKPEIVIAPESTESYPCIKCGSPTASKELGRCITCDIEHQKIIAQLDAKPKQIIEKVPEKWVYYKQKTGGIVVTVRMTEEEALLSGKKIQ